MGDRGRRGIRILREYLGGLAIGFMAFPLLVAVGAVLVYLAGAASGTSISGARSVELALLSALLIWPLLGVVFRPLVTARGASAYECDQLKQRSTEVWWRIAQLTAAQGSKARTLAPQQQQLFSGAGAQWASGNGYLTLWTKIHEAEEALLLVEPIDRVLGQANRDLQRLNGSSMGQRDEWITTLTNAVRALNARSRCHFWFFRTRDSSNADSWISESQAREMLRNVRQALNEYRESLWEGIVRTRNQFIKTLVATVVLLGFVVVLLVVRDTSPQMIFVATLLFSAGALVGGLFGRLSQLFPATNMEEDFGLDTTHLLAAPIFSGIAAVAAVLVVGLAHVSVGGMNVAAPAVTNGSSVAGILNLGANPGALVVAALFGLTPGLLISYLKTQSDQFLQGLSSSETYGQAGSSGVGGQPAKAANPAPKPSSSRKAM